VRVLVVNAGSSSFKLRLLGSDDAVLGERDLAANPSEAEMLRVVRDLGETDAVGHRIVHGGRRYLGPVLIDAGVEAGLRDLVDLAPLHQPKSLEALDTVSRALPDTPAVACFDTAFHAGLPAAAATYALPASWRERWGLRRYGFHGLSHSYAAQHAARMIARPVAALRVVTCHLGAGASLAAVQGGRSVDTTMGFTPLEGLVMATRSGSVDPGLLLWLLERADMDEREMAHALEHESGLAGLAGDGDMRTVLAAAEQGDDRSQLALDVYVYRLSTGIAAMAAAMGGLDALVFTGGVGERAPTIRAAATERLAFLGIEVDANANRSAAGDAEISARGAPVRALVITSREDLEIARQTREALGPGSRG
jgi:acetate kinase